MTKTNNTNGINSDSFHPSLRPPALQAGGRGIVTLSAHHQPADSTYILHRLTHCPPLAGGHESCLFHAKPAKKTESAGGGM